RRRALAYLLRHVDRFSQEELRGAVVANWNSDDRLIRAATTDLIARFNAKAQIDLLREAKAPFERTTIALAIASGYLGTAARYVDAIIANEQAPSEARLAAARVIQRTLDDGISSQHFNSIWEGYTARVDRTGLLWSKILARSAPELRAAFPSGDADLDRELSRTLAMIEDRDPGVLLRTAERLTDDSDPLDDIHYLTVVACLTAPRPIEVTTRTAAALVNLDGKLDARSARRDLHFPLRIAELHAELSKRDSRLNRDILAHPDFGRPAHVLLTRAPGFDRRRAADLILARMAPGEDEDDEKLSLWTPEHVELLGELPAEWSLPMLRRLWGRAGLDDAVLELLARDPQMADRQRLIEGLASAQPATVAQALQALAALSAPGDDELLAVVRALSRLSDGKESDLLRGELLAALRRISGLEVAPDDARGWQAWLRVARPELAARLSGDGVDAAAWSQRLAAIDWSSGDARRGHGVFVQASCAACHSAGRALGPDLNGVAGRFSRDDLFTAIVEPSRDVSSRYRTVSLATAAGKTYQGMIVYDAVDGVILQTGASTTVRVPGDEIVVRRPSTASLMPSGLLDKLSDAQIADLYAYLNSLR
ncbi:MAG TPA: hypothetical protein VF306_03470, partial [Pirellulales bacterium]